MLALTDRFSPLAIKPRSFDYLLGLSTRDGNIKVQFDREEFLPLDISGLNYHYWDVRGSYLINYPKTGGGRNSPAPYGINGVLSVGYFLDNDGTPARLDNTGVAFLRYRAALNVSLFQGRLLLRGDSDFLTDKNQRRYDPTDLDLALGVGTSFQNFEIMFYRKSRQALDEQGYVSYYFLSLRTYFDSRSK